MSANGIFFLIVFSFVMAAAVKAGTGKTMGDNIRETKATRAARKAAKDENTLTVVDDQAPEHDIKSDIAKQCLTEQLLFVEDLISSESNPEKTLKYMKEKQRRLTALADL